VKTGTDSLPRLRSAKVLDQLRERIRYMHYNIRTEQTYVHWVRAYIHFHGLQHPATLGGAEVGAFRSWLANVRRVSASTHRQALAALLFCSSTTRCCMSICHAYAKKFPVLDDLFGHQLPWLLLARV